MDLDPGSMIDDRYVIDEAIGEGGMAVVYRAHHVQLGTKHAVKVLTIGSRAVRERMLQEGRVQASLRHPNIVAVTDVVTMGGSPALVMELIDGPPLDDLLHKQKLTIAQADTIGRGILAAVTYAHERGLIHRDLKPANVMLEIEGAEVRPKVTDFGLAKVLHGDDDKRAATRTGSTMGTPQYMSPEQILDSKNVDERSDVFALGAILYELVTGERAFDGDNVMEIFKRVSECAYRPVRELRPDAPERMVRAIEAALVVDKDARIATSRALFEMFTDGEALPAASFTSAELAALSLGGASSPGTLAPPANTARSAPSIVRSPAVIGGGLFAVGALVLAGLLVVVLAIGAALYLSADTSTPDDPTTVEQVEPQPDVPEPDAPGEEPPDGTPVLPEPASQPSPGTPTEEDPVEEDPTEEPEDVDALADPMDEPGDEEPAEEDPPADDPVEEPVPEEVPEPVATPDPADPAPVATGTILDSVPLSMRSMGTSGADAIWSRRDDRSPRMNGWMVIVMKERALPASSRDRAVQALAHRWRLGYAPQDVYEPAMEWAAVNASRSSRRRALDALSAHATRLNGPKAALKSSDAGTQTAAIDALAAVARRTGQQAQAKTALEAYLTGDPTAKNIKRAKAAIAAL